MKSKFFMGILALMILLLALPGAVSAADVTVSGSIVKPDLVVTAISPNVGAGAFMFANEPNVISVTVKNDGGLDAAVSTVSIVVGSNTYTAAVGSLAAGASETVMVTDPASYTVSTVVSYTATADSAGVIAESNEANNALTTPLSVFNNGYKGKRWTPTLGGDMETQATFDGRYGLVYSTGDSSYWGRDTWNGKTVTWTSANLPIPAGATVTSARLYQGYSANNDPVTYPNPNPGMSFNGVTKTPIATYKDTKGYGGNDFPYGLLTYDVTSQFNTAGNTLVYTQEAPSYAVYGAYLVVVYQDPATSLKKIWINDEFDLLYPGAARSVTNDEATTFVPFAGVDTTGISSAKVIAIAPSCDEVKNPISSTFFFNSQTFTTAIGTGYLATPQIAFKEYDVASALTAGVNEARMQSTISGTSGDFMAVSNAILIVEKSEGVIDVTVNPTTIDFGTMQAGIDETGSTTVNVDVTGGTAWSVTASATNGGYMGTGTINLANPFQLSKDGTNFQAMNSNFANFLTGAAGVDGSGTASVKQAIAPADAPGTYSITLTFTAAFN